MSDYLPNAQNSKIGDYANFSNVRGDQYNYNQITPGEGSQRKRYIAGTEKEEAHYAEYHDVRRGDIIIKRDLCTSKSGPWFFDEEKQKWVWVGCERRLLTAEVRSEVGKVSSSYTVVAYHGPEKEEAWKKDFYEFSGALISTNVQVFGYNRSETPLLLLYNDLVPLAHFLDSVGGLGQVYLRLLTKQLGCMGVKLWLDSSRGVLCRGPQGPYCFIRSDIRHGDILNIPSDGKMLQEDLLIRYLATLQRNRDLDRTFVEGISWSYIPHTSDMRVNRPTVISSLTNTAITVAAAGMIPVWTFSSCLRVREVLSNGLSRFTLKHHGCRLDLIWDWQEAKRSWMAQSSMVFHARGIPPESDLRKYDVILPDSLRCTLSRSRSKRQRRQECKPIYLFVRSLPISVFWSFEEDGHIPIPDDLCKYLGLPIKFLPESDTFCFPNQNYKAMRDYQILRGFDPTTTDFARHCGFYDLVFEPVESSLTTTPSRFEELDVADSKRETTEDLYKSLPTLFGDVPVEDDLPEPAEPLTRRALNVNVWSSLSQAAWKVSDILAMGF